MKYERAIDGWQRTSSHHRLLTHLPLRRIRHAARASDVVGGVETQEQLDLLAAEDSEVKAICSPGLCRRRICVGALCLLCGACFVLVGGQPARGPGRAAFEEYDARIIRIKGRPEP